MGSGTPQSGPGGSLMGPQTLPGPYLDPTCNNLPLNFKGKIRLPNDDGDGKDTSSNNGLMTPVPPPPSAVMNNMMMPWGPMMGMPDPNMMMWGPWGPMSMGPAPPEAQLPQAQREVIRLKGAVLYPPPPNSQPQTYRARPPGCRTVFVGGLPDNTTEEIVREMLENCGAICSLRLSKKNFAHVRFEVHDSVERALFFAGYRMKVEDKDDKPNTGRIHVDYAQARDDLYEYECMQRAFERENRHRERMEEEMLRPPSPPKVIHYSDHEAMMLVDTLKADESFLKGVQTLVTWLDRGDCNRRTSNTFYSLLQSTNVHVRRLMNEKAENLNELEQMKIKFNQRFEAIINQRS